MCNFGVIGTKLVLLPRTFPTPNPHPLFPLPHLPCCDLRIDLCWLHEKCHRMATIPLLRRHCAEDIMTAWKVLSSISICNGHCPFLYKLLQHFQTGRYLGCPHHLIICLQVFPYAVSDQHTNSHLPIGE